MSRREAKPSRVEASSCKTLTQHFSFSQSFQGSTRSPCTPFEPCPIELFCPIADPGPSAPQGIPLATLPSPTGAGEYTTKFNEYCLRHRLARTFRLERDPDGEEGWHICRLTWVGKGVPSRWVEAKGMGKQHAKNK